MKQYYRYDENWYYVEPVIAYYEESLPDGITDIRPPDGLYRAQFNGNEWIETGGPPIVPIEDIKAQKLREISVACSQAIYNGMEIETTKGTESFALTIEDQKNILAQTAFAEQGLSVLYHADGKPCRLFDPQEFVAVSRTCFAFITYHTTLCNFYNTWIRQSETKEELNEIVYGASLPIDLANEDGQSFDDLMDVILTYPKI